MHEKIEKPFGPQSRTGFELELVAPRGLGRAHLAEHLAERFGGRVEFGLKYHSDAIHQTGRPVCHLTPAYRVFDGLGREVATLVDDNTIVKNLEADAPPTVGQFRIVVDDVRLALSIERSSWTSRWSPAHVLERFLGSFEGCLLPRGTPPAQHDDHQVAIDPFGHPLAVVALYGGERHRACEIVTRPLRRAERFEVLKELLAAAQELGFFVPYEGALHLHFDNSPWMSTGRLRQLILEFCDHRDRLRKVLAPNPACTKLGPLSPDLRKVAEQTPPDGNFDELRRALNAVGVVKHVDLNLLGIVRERPRHPTLEFRALPMTLDVERLDDLVEQVEAFLLTAAMRADAEGEMVRASVV